MTIVALALANPAAACETVEIDVEGVDVSVADCGHEHDDDWDDEEGEDDEPPAASVSGHHGGGQELQLQYGMQFLPQMPGHQLGAKFTGEKDSYVSGELRYMPASDLLWTGRVGAGLDVLGQSEWDLTLGLFLGSAGEWDRATDQAELYAAPIAGTEVGLGYEGDRLFGRYRWLGGIGGGPIDELLTENEFTLGYKVMSSVHVYGQYLILSPGELDNQAGVGLGARLAF